MESSHCKKPVLVASTKEISSIGEVEVHMLELYRRISNPFPTSITSYLGHSIRSQVGGNTPTLLSPSLIKRRDKTDSDDEERKRIRQHSLKRLEAMVVWRSC